MGGLLVDCTVIQCVTLCWFTRPGAPQDKKDTKAKKEKKATKRRKFKNVSGSTARRCEAPRLCLLYSLSSVLSC